MAILVAFIQISFAATVWGNFDLSVSNEYRMDRINWLSQFSTSTNAFAGNVFVRAKDIKIYQVRGIAIWTDECYHLYARGEASYGWLLSGKDTTLERVADMKGLPIADFSGSLGYIVDVCGCFEFIPQVGYSYSIFETKLKNTKFTPATANNVPRRLTVDSLDGVKLKYRTPTPFIGFDVRFNNCLCDTYAINYTAGYEFHWGKNHDQYIYPGNPPFRRLPAEPPFRTRSTISSSTHIPMILHHFRLGADITICGGFYAGVHVKYIYGYNTNKARRRFDSSLIDSYHANGLLVDTNFDTTYFTTQSFTAGIRVGYYF